MLQQCAVEVLKGFLTDVRFPCYIRITFIQIATEVEAHINLSRFSGVYCGEGFAVIRAPGYGLGECYGEAVQFQSGQVGIGRYS